MNSLPCSSMPIETSQVSGLFLMLKSVGPLIGSSVFYSKSFSYLWFHIPLQFVFQLFIEKWSTIEQLTSAWDLIDTFLGLQGNGVTLDFKIQSFCKNSYWWITKGQTWTTWPFLHLLQYKCTRSSPEASLEATRKETVWLAKLKPDLHLKNVECARLCANVMGKGCR